MAVSDFTPGPHDEQFWYNLQTGAVERGAQNIASHLWGPFATEAEAQNAMKKAQERNEAWDNDSKWND